MRNPVKSTNIVCDLSKDILRKKGVKELYTSKSQNADSLSSHFIWVP